MLAPAPLAGLRVLLVEDNFLLAEVHQGSVGAEWLHVVGPAGRVESALKLACGERLDGAILDINLHGEMSFVVADVLCERGVPFLFVTGY